MSLTSLEKHAYNLRISILRATTQAGSGHVTSALSAADIVTALFFDTMHFDPNDHDNTCNDRFILSKGHAAPVLYAVWKELGVISDEELLTLRQFNSRLEGHPTPRFAWSEAATGSLGQGLSSGVGMALSARLSENNSFTYVLMGDGEIAEGSIWEACELAAYYKLTHLIGIVDCNRLGQSQATMFEHNVTNVAAKFSAFGFNTYIIDGHNMNEIVTTLRTVRDAITAGHNAKPTMIIAQKIKMDFMVKHLVTKNYQTFLQHLKNGLHLLRR
jgi:transketolase